MSQKGIIKNTLTRNDIDASDFARIFFAFFNVNFIMEQGNNLAVTKQNDNTIRMQSGMVMTDRTVISVDNYIDLTIESGTLGLNRKGYVIANFIEDGVETGQDLAQIEVLYGEAVTGTAEFPELTNTDTTSQVAIIEFEINDTTLAINTVPLLDVLSLNVILHSVLFYLANSTNTMKVGNYTEWCKANRPIMED